MMKQELDYGDHAPKANDGQLSELSQLVDDMEAQQVRVAEIEEQLKTEKAALRAYAENRIPDLMGRIGVDTITTSSGVTVSLKTTYRASPKVANREIAWTWLEENGHGGLLKQELSVAFARGQDEDVAELEAQLREKYDSVKNNRGVHPSTLKAWVKEMIEGGKTIPMDVFGAEVIQQAQVKRKS